MSGCPLSRRQWEALLAIAGFRAQHRRAPSMRELGDLLALRTSSSPHVLYAQLEELGALHIPRTGGPSPRRIAYLAELTPRGREWLAARSEH